MPTLKNSTITLALAALVSTPSTAAAKAADARIAHPKALPIAGTYTMEVTENLTNRLKVRRIGKDKIWFVLNAYFPYYDSNGGQGANMGECEDTIALKGDTAVWKSTLAEPGTQASLVFHFVRGACEITQNGQDFELGFGHNVNAGGLYKKISSRLISGKDDRTTQCQSK